jgi:hypothetical protein
MLKQQLLRGLQALFVLMYVCVCVCVCEYAIMIKLFQFKYNNYVFYLHYGQNVSATVYFLFQF